MWRVHNRHRHEELCNHHDIDGNTDHTDSDNHSNINSDNSHEHLQRILPQVPTHIPMSVRSGAVEQTGRGDSHEHLQIFLPPLPTHIYMSVRSGAVEQSRLSGVYPFSYSFGDINQLPPVGQTGRGRRRPRQRGPPTPVMAQYLVKYSFRGYDFNAVQSSPTPTPASLMDAEQPEHFGFSDASNQM